MNYCYIGNKLCETFSESGEYELEIQKRKSDLVNSCERIRNNVQVKFDHILINTVEFT